MTLQTYTPSQAFTHTSGLLGNHFRFDLAALPDVSFFAQVVTLPTVQSTIVPRATPFSTIPEVGDHLTFSTFDVTFQIDAAMKTYYSIWHWLSGYGFPEGFDDLVNFALFREQQIFTGRPTLRDIHKTTAQLHVLQPDTQRIISSFTFDDVFPTALGSMTFDVGTLDPAVLQCTATFACSTFRVTLQ